MKVVLRDSMYSHETLYSPNVGWPGGTGDTAPLIGKWPQLRLREA